MTITYESIVEQARGHEPVVRVQREAHHAIVTLDDPQRLNPLSAHLTIQLHDALRELAGDAAVRAIVLTGTDPAFSAGGDLRLMTEVAHPMVDDSAAGATGAWRWIG